MKMKYFKLAKTLSKKSNHPSHHLGAVLVKKNKIVSVGWNTCKTHPKSPHQFKTIHAEFMAILGVHPKDLQDAHIYVYRERKNGEPALAKPCETCYNLIQQVGIETVFYSDYNSYRKEWVQNG